RTYGAQRDPVLVDGRFDGWHWYVWRARAELALRRGRWDAVVADARRCIAARPASGKEYLLLAVAEGRLGHDADAAEAAHRAATLDTGLPEALYLDGLWAWRAGRRAEAQSRFRAAVATDPGYQPAGIALVRSRLAGVAPDSLPAAFLTGGRQAAMITSPVGPKIEQFVQLDHPAIIGHKVDPVVPDSLKKYFARFNLPVWVLVDENGRVVTSEIGWFDPAVVPVSVVADLVGDLPFWTFVPAQVAGMPRRVWVDLLYQFPL
ncbi:MAG: hypothetical protein HY076_00995, partial [Candidatus Eisenbacteria bacterium]|nr:hypothetical protein [Candidatus Eisenbacteria bacterium]